MRARGEEAVSAVPLAEVVVLPRLPACGGAGQDGLPVDEDVTGAHVAAKQSAVLQAAVWVRCKIANGTVRYRELAG